MNILYFLIFGSALTLPQNLADNMPVGATAGRRPGTLGPWDVGTVGSVGSVPGNPNPIPLPPDPPLPPGITLDRPQTEERRENNPVNSPVKPAEPPTNPNKDDQTQNNNQNVAKPGGNIMGDDGNNNNNGGSAQNNSNSGLTSAALTAIVLCTLIGLAVLFFAAGYIRKRRQENRDDGFMFDRDNDENLHNLDPPTAQDLEAARLRKEAADAVIAKKAADSVAAVPFPVNPSEVLPKDQNLELMDKVEAEKAAEKSDESVEPFEEEEEETIEPEIDLGSPELMKPRSLNDLVGAKTSTADLSEAEQAELDQPLLSEDNYVGYLKKLIEKNEAR